MVIFEFSFLLKETQTESHDESIMAMIRGRNTTGLQAAHSYLKQRAWPKWRVGKSKLNAYKICASFLWFSIELFQSANMPVISLHGCMSWFLLNPKISCIGTITLIAIFCFWTSLTFTYYTITFINIKLLPQYTHIPYLLKPNYINFSWEEI